MKPDKIQKIYTWGISIFVTAILVTGALWYAHEPTLSGTSLECTEDKILYSEEKDGVVKYLYNSDVEVSQVKGEDISKRTKNAQFFPQEDKTVVRFYTGEPFYKENDKWYQTETATTTKEVFEVETNMVIGASGDPIYSGAGDGWTAEETDVQSWDTAHDKTTSGFADYTSSGANVNFPGTRYFDTDRFGIYRQFDPIDTSALPDNPTITGATFNVYVESIQNGDDDGDDFIRMVQTDQPDPTELTTADFNNCGATDNPTAGATDIDIGDIVDDNYNVFTFNADPGYTWIIDDGYTMIGLREGHDVLDHAITTGINWMQIRPSEYADTTYDPYLTVTYTAGGAVEEEPKQSIIFFD